MTLRVLFTQLQQSWPFFASSILPPISPHLLFVCLFFHHIAYGILAPRPGIGPAPPAVEVWNLNHWTTREVPTSNYFKANPTDFH